MNEPRIKLSVNHWLLSPSIIEEILQPAIFIDRIIEICEDEYDVYLKEDYDFEDCRKKMSDLFESVGYVPMMHFLIY